MCEALKAKGIRYEVWQGLKSRYGKGAVIFRYAVGVLPEDAERARAIWDLPEKVVEEDEDEDAAEPEDEPVDPEGELPEGKYEPEDHHRIDAYLKHWYPEDATVDVWTQLASADSYGLDMALNENYIRWRIETMDDGSKKFYVMPEDEARAREIVREVVDGVPPE